MEDFIEDATKEKLAARARKRPKKEDILLSIAGRMNRAEDCGKQHIIYIRKDIKRDLQKHCIGNFQSIVNYLLRRGLDNLMEKNEFVLEQEF